MKRTIQTYTFLLTLLALLQACNDPSPLGRMGGAIDSLIEQRPDSVLHLHVDNVRRLKVYTNRMKNKIYFNNSMFNTTLKKINTGKIKPINIFIIK